jgi:hypothetical protein
MLGFFAFIGAVAGALVVGRAAQEQYRRGESNMNPLVCTVAAFVALLLLTAVLASVK